MSSEVLKAAMGTVGKGLGFMQRWGPGETLARGALGMGGIIPAGVMTATTAGGAVSDMNIWHGYTVDAGFDKYGKMGHLEAKGMPKTWGARGAIGMQLVAPIVSGYTIYQGYQQDGVSGAYDAAILDLGVNAAYIKHGFKTAGGLGTGFKSTKVGIGALGTFGRIGGATVGGSIGQAMGQATGIPFAGTVGALVGSSFGAAPVQGAKQGMAALAASPRLLAAGLAGAAVLGTATVVNQAARGGYSVLKAGYQHKRMQRGIQTSGDLSAFMTQGAMTMRSRAVSNIAKSHMNARSALGREASFLHSSANRSYHSRYR